MLEVAELETNGTSALVEIDVSACDIWALECKSFVWFEVIACNAYQLENQLPYPLCSEVWARLFCYATAIMDLGEGAQKVEAFRR